MTKNEKEIFDETLKAIKDERDRLREALEELTSACEQHHRIVYMGWSWDKYDKYEFAFDSRHDNPVKRARAALEGAMR